MTLLDDWKKSLDVRLQDAATGAIIAARLLGLGEAAVTVTAFEIVLFGLVGLKVAGPDWPAQRVCMEKILATVQEIMAGGGSGGSETGREQTGVDGAAGETPPVSER